MNPIRRIAAVLASLAAGLVAFGATPAFASVPPYGRPVGSSRPPAIRTVSHTLVLGGMPGWQIALIAAGAALLTAAVAVLAYRAWTIRRKPATAMRTDRAVPPALIRARGTASGQRHPP